MKIWALSLSITIEHDGYGELSAGPHWIRCEDADIDLQSLIDRNKESIYNEYYTLQCFENGKELFSTIYKYDCNTEVELLRLIEKQGLGS